MSTFSDSCTFRIVVLVLSIVIIGIAIANIVFFNRIRQNPTSEISSTTAIVMMVMNVIIIILSLGLLIWAAVGLSYCRSTGVPPAVPAVVVSEPAPVAVVRHTEPQYVTVPHSQQQYVTMPQEQYVTVPQPQQQYVTVSQPRPQVVVKRQPSYVVTPASQVVTQPIGVSEVDFPRTTYNLPPRQQIVTTDGVRYVV